MNNVETPETPVKEKTVEQLHMPVINNMTLSGRITQKPFKGTTANNEVFVKFRMAHNGFDSSKTSNSTIFIDVTCWEKLGESVLKNINVGSPVVVTGRLSFSKWNDSKTNSEQSKLYITANNISFLRKSDIFKNES